MKRTKILLHFHKFLRIPNLCRVYIVYAQIAFERLKFLKWTGTNWKHFFWQAHMNIIWSRAKNLFIKIFFLNHPPLHLPPSYLDTMIYKVAHTTKQLIHVCKLIILILEYINVVQRYVLTLPKNTHCAPNLRSANCTLSGSLR